MTVTPPPSPQAHARRPETAATRHISNSAAPLNACQLATGQEDGLDQAPEANGLYRICDAFPQDEPWNYNDAEQRGARLPRLTKLLS